MSTIRTEASLDLRLWTQRLARSTTILALSLIMSIAAIAAEPLDFEDPALEQRFQQLTLQLRCLVCQNQNLADSDAPLAHDLRQEIHDMLITGSSDEQIRQFMVQRYGDFVLYRPPVQGNTLVLWLLPLFLLVLGTGVAWVVIRRYGRLPMESAAPAVPSSHRTEPEGGES